MTFQSILITGGSEQDRLDKAKEILRTETINPIDILWINQEEAIGIEQIRFLTKSLILKPHSSPYHAAVIHNAQNLTPEAQNALLKLLEEPPQSSLIILTTLTDDLLLPTVVSRCHVYRLPSSADTISSDDKNTVENIMTGSLASLMELASAYEKKREETITFIDLLTAALRADLYSLYRDSGAKDQTHTGHQYDLLLSLLQEAREAVVGYGNPRLALEYLFISFRLSASALQK